MTLDTLPSALAGDTLKYPSQGAIFGIAMPYMIGMPTPYTDLPRYWTPYRDWVLSNSVHKEDMWAASVAIAATKFAAHGYVIKDGNDSTRKVSASQELLKRADGGEGWVPFALKTMRDLLTCDNGIFIRIRRDGDQTQKIRVKAAPDGPAFDEAAVTVSKPGAKISGLYHMDSLRCIRTGNLAYPVRYWAVDGTQALLRWDQVLMYADQPSPRAELFGVGMCAASRSYKTIAKISAMEQLIYENLTGGGFNKLVFLQGIQDATLQGILASGEEHAHAKGLLYYLGTVLGAIPSDTPISSVEIKLKELLENFKATEERDNAYLIYADNIGIPAHAIQPLRGQGLGTGTQTVMLDDAAKGQGALPAFLKWWEQTVSDRVLPATTELQFVDENDMRDQKAKADVQSTRATTRAARIASGEISPAMARQIAVDDEDLDPEMVANDATAGGQITDDEKPQTDVMRSQAALALIAGAPLTPPSGGAGTATKDHADDEAAALLDQELTMATTLSREAMRR